MTSRAEKIVASLAKEFTEDGWQVKVEREHTPAEYFSNGDLLADGRTRVRFTATRGVFDGYFHAAWIAYDGTGRFRAVTKFLCGSYSPALGTEQHEFRTYRDLWSWTGTLTYAKRGPREEASS